MSSSLYCLRNVILTSSLATLLASTSIVAQDFIPGSVVPGRIQTEVVPLPRPLPATQIHYAEFPTYKIDLVFPKKSRRLRNVLIRNQSIPFPPELDTLIRPYLGYLITEKNVSQLADSVAQFYRQRGYFAAQVVVPKQKLRQGVLVLVLYDGAVSHVQIENKSPRIQNALQHYADSISGVNPLMHNTLEPQILLAGEIFGSRLKADVTPDSERPGCVKVTLTADLQRLGADLGYDNYGVRWQGPQQYAANITGNSLLQAGDHTHVNGMMSVDGKDLRYYAAEHDMPLGYSGNRLLLWTNYAENEPGFTLRPLDLDGKALSGGILASHPLVLTQSMQFWTRLGLRFIDEEIQSHDERFLKDSDRVALISADVDFHDCWHGETRAALILSHGFDILGASKNHILDSEFKGETNFTKVNAELNYTRPLVDNFSFMMGGEGQYGFDPLLVSELMGVGGRYWGRAYDWSEIMGDSGVVGTVELRYDTKPGAPEHKNAQYFLAYDAGEVWTRHVHPGHQSLTSLQAGLRLDFTRYISADLVVAKPLTRDVLAREAAGHGGDKIRAFFRVAVHL